jgi:tripartite motif-containing protein 71
VAVRSALTYEYEINSSIEYLISICFIFIFSFASFLIVNNIYAQQGGAATGGNATGGPTIGGPANCYGQCYFYGGPATGGSATGGNAISSEGKGGQSQIHNNSNNIVNSQSGILDTKNNTIAIATTNKVSADIAKSYSFVKKWGTEGSADGQFREPRGIAVDQSDNVYVADTGNNRIQKFDSNGNFITKLNSSDQAILFHGPESVSVDYLGNVYVADTGGNGILKFTNNGTYIGALTTFEPKGVATDNFGSVYAAMGDKEIRKKLVNSSFLDPWTNYTSFKFTNGVGLAVDSNNNVYVTDSGNNRVEKFSDNGTLISILGKSGKKDGQFLSPLAITVDQSDNVYVADTGNNRIQKFDSNGNFITKIGSAGSGDGQFLYPTGVAIDLHNLYVTDRSNNRVQVYSSSIR